MPSGNLWCSEGLIVLQVLTFDLPVETEGIKKKKFFWLQLKSLLSNPKGKRLNLSISLSHNHVHNSPQLKAPPVCILNIYSDWWGNCLWRPELSRYLLGQLHAISVIEFGFKWQQRSKSYSLFTRNELSFGAHSQQNPFSVLAVWRCLSTENGVTIVTGN